MYDSYINCYVDIVILQYKLIFFLNTINVFYYDTLIWTIKIKSFIFYGIKNNVILILKLLIDLSILFIYS